MEKRDNVGKFFWGERPDREKPGPGDPVGGGRVHVKRNNRAPIAKRVGVSNNRVPMAKRVHPFVCGGTASTYIGCGVIPFGGG